MANHSGHDDGTKPIAALKFGAVLALARKKKSPAEARESLSEIGILNKDGSLADHYKAKSPRTGKPAKGPKTKLESRSTKSRGKIESS